MKLKNIKITDKNPLLIQFGAYAKWDGPKDIISPREEGPDLIHFLDEEIFEILEHSKVLKILEYFAKVCTPSLSPQCLFKTEKVDYVSLILEYSYKVQKFEEVIKNLLELSEEKIENQVKESNITEPKNLEEQAISLVGKDIYEKLIKGYTEKQWGRRCTELPAFIIKRLPVRYTYDNNYFNDKYQGSPEGGYNVIFDKLLEGIDVELNVDFFDKKGELLQKADKIVFTGMIDQYFDYQYGVLEYRSLRFEHETLDEENHQGNAVVNYNEREVPYTRIIEHKHFEFGKQPKTVITREYPAEWKQGDEPYYPVNNEKNAEIFKKYQELAEKEENVIFGGRLADYRYYDMHHVFERALEVVKEELDK